MRELSISELRKIELDILLTVHNFCEERGIRYSLGGGTLLGAVRHKGFIPWDDDVDIMMPRPDYERFIKEFNGYDESLICGCFELYPHFTFPFMKLYDKRTVLKEEGVLYPLGVNIDIFPIDGVPEKYSKHIANVHIIKRLIHFNSAMMDWSRGVKRVVFTLFAKVLSISFLQKKCKRLLLKYDYNNSAYAGAITGCYGEREVHSKSIFEDYITLEFEGEGLKVISSYDTYLKQHYGNYMQLPPKDKQVSPHNLKAWVL